jgi:hypothetical protein
MNRPWYNKIDCLNNLYVNDKSDRLRHLAIYYGLIV